MNLRQIANDILRGRPPRGLATMQASISQKYTVECFRRGKLIWVAHVDNLVVTVGLTDILDKYFKGSTYNAAHYVGLYTGSNPVAGDTMASHGFTENTQYDEANRPTITWGTFSAGTGNNSASKAVFTMSGTVTIVGAFVVTTNNKGGATGTLVGGGAFTEGSRSVVDNDVLNVTVTATLTAS